MANGALSESELIDIRAAIQRLGLPAVARALNMPASTLARVAAGGAYHAGTASLIRERRGAPGLAMAADDAGRERGR